VENRLGIDGQVLPAMGQKNHEDDSANVRNSTLNDAGALRAKREHIRASVSPRRCEKGNAVVPAPCGTRFGSNAWTQ
jgi:hypothetical protein